MADFLSMSSCVWMSFHAIVRARCHASAPDSFHVPPCLDNKRRATGSIASCGAFEFVKDMVSSVGSLVSRKTSTLSVVIVIEFMFFHGDCYGSVSFEDCQVNNASFLFSLYHVSASVVDIQRRLYYVLDFVIVISFSVSDKARGVYLDPGV